MTLFCIYDHLFIIQIWGTSVRILSFHEFRAKCMVFFEAQSVMLVYIWAFLTHFGSVLVTVGASVLFWCWDAPVVQSIISNSIWDSLVDRLSVLWSICILGFVCILDQVCLDNVPPKFQQVKEGLLFLVLSFDRSAKHYGCLPLHRKRTLATTIFWISLQRDTLQYFDPFYRFSATHVLVVLCHQIWQLNCDLFLLWWGPSCADSYWTDTVDVACQVYWSVVVPSNNKH